MTTVFIDGTVEGTDVKTGNTDSNTGHDHTYYGNGCPNDWGTDGDGGSNKSCSTRIIGTRDGENQKTGTLYDLQAATSGTNGSAPTGDLTPDTFCPLGWQLPYGGTGGDYYDKSRSWEYLFNEYSLGSGVSGANAVRSYPMSYILPGVYNWITGLLYFQDRNGYYWSGIAVYVQQISIEKLVQASVARMFGYPLR